MKTIYIELSLSFDRDNKQHTRTKIVPEVELNFNIAVKESQGPWNEGRVEEYLISQHFVEENNINSGATNLELTYKVLTEEEQEELVNNHETIEQWVACANDRHGNEFVDPQYFELEIGELSKKFGLTAEEVVHYNFEGEDREEEDYTSSYEIGCQEFFLLDTKVLEIKEKRMEELFEYFNESRYGLFEGDLEISVEKAIENISDNFKSEFEREEFEDWVWERV